jgi:hypothetical protein
MVANRLEVGMRSDAASRRKALAASITAASETLTSTALDG